MKSKTLTLQLPAFHDRSVESDRVSLSLLRAALVAVGTLLHRMLVLAVMMAIEQQWMEFPWTATLIETGLNTAVALVAFQVTDSLPGMVERGRASRRSSLSRRQW